MQNLRENERVWVSTGAQVRKVSSWSIPGENGFHNTVKGVLKLKLRAWAMITLARLVTGSQPCRS